MLFGIQGFLLLSLLYSLGKGHLKQGWLWLLMAFVGLALLKADQILAGWMGLATVVLVWKHLQQVYAGDIRPWILVSAGSLMAVTLWFAFYPGLAVTLGIGLFSVLHCFLHEREEKNISYGQVANRDVWVRWLRLWGRYGLLSFFLTLGVCVVICVFFNYGKSLPLGALNRVSSFDQVATSVGYFSTFHQEFLAIFKPLNAEGISDSTGLVLSDALKATHLFLIGFLPVLGIVGLGYQVPNRFVYRLLQRPDEELLLIFIAGTTLILGTLANSTSGEIASFGAIAFLMGFIVLTRWLSVRPGLEKLTYGLLWIVCVLWVVIYGWDVFGLNL